MRSFLGFVVFVAVLIGVLVFAVLPLVVGPLIANAIQQSGAIQGGLSVDAQGSGPGFISGRADALRLHGSDVSVQGVLVGDVDVTLHGVSLAAKTFDTVDGTLRGVQLQVPGGPAVTVPSVALDGPSGAVRATGALSAAATSVVVREAARRAGVALDGVTLGDGSVSVRRGGVSVPAKLAVRGGALVLVASGLPSVALAVPDANDSWHVSGVTVTPTGIQLSGILDATDLLASGGVLTP